MEASSSSGASSSECDGLCKSQAVTFTVEFDDEPKNPKRMPKNLSSARLMGKQKLSEEILTKKQRLAEERRKVNYCEVIYLAG